MPTRRQFVLTTALGLGAYMLRLPDVTAAPQRDPPPSPARSPRGSMSAVQYRTLQAAAERLLPADEDPGAIGLGVHVYIDGALGDPGLILHKPWLLAMLDGLEAEARRGGIAYARLDGESQDRLLRAWQAGDRARRYAFELVLTLVLEGAFGDPRHGGNTGGRGWEMLGFHPGRER